MPEPEPLTYETRDAPALPVFLFLVAVAVMVSVAMWSLYQWPAARELGGRTGPIEAPVAPAPRLEREIGETLRRVRAEEDERLGQYAWIDRGSGIARIPLERAIEITAERGLDGGRR